MNGKELRQILDKFLKAEAASQARIQVALPDGKYYDITSLQLMENKLFGVRETHRLVFTRDDTHTLVFTIDDTQSLVFTVDDTQTLVFTINDTDISI